MTTNVTGNDIAVVIPTYRYRSLIEETVRTALDSSAGEIIVSDDNSGDGTIDTLSKINDRRLKLVSQTNNLGLWVHHRAALQYSTRPWIKFIQADDRLLPGAIDRMASVITPDVSLVWSNPIFCDYDSGLQWRRYTLEGPMLLTSQEIFKLMCDVGLFLGTPSHMLIRRDAFDMSDAAWRNDTSADVIMGTNAASVGSVVCLPEGNVLHGVHPGQDGRTQSHELSTLRLMNTLKYLRANSCPAAETFVAGFCALEVFAWARSTVGALRRHQVVRPNALRSGVELLKFIPFLKALQNRRTVASMYHRKYSRDRVALSNPRFIG